MIRIAIIIVLSAALLVTGATIASSDAPQPTYAQLKAKNRALVSRNQDQQDEIDAQDDLISAQTNLIARLRARDPLDVITARGLDGLWAAMIAIWQAFPSLGPGDFCGYDKSTVPSAGVGLTVTSYTFYSWSGC